MNRKSLIKVCDNLTREIVFAMSKHTCIRCKLKATDPAHIIGRRYLRHRWRIFNVLPLCRKCYKWFDEQSTKEERELLLKLEAPEHFAYLESASVTAGATVSTIQIEQTRTDLQNILRSIKGV